jgi:hypothetical protein
MKISQILIPGALVLFLAITSFFACGNDAIGPDSERPYSGDDPALRVSLNEEDMDGLIFMREEEKLARDVYIFLYDMYGVKSFDNISKSEQVHMDVILDLLEKYDIEDPALEENGKFTNEELQQLYDQLIEQGRESETAALKVGATIEDVDIRDLDMFIAATTQQDVIDGYELLNCGSRNHMRAFVRQLDNYGLEYTPQFITQDEFDGIINGGHEKCGQLYR